MRKFELDTTASDQQLRENLESLANNEYPGRFLAIGVAQSGRIALQAYALTGRRDGSRDRVLIDDGDGIRAVAPNKSPQEMAETPNAELIYYRAMQDRGGVHVVSNGAHTEPIIWNLLCGDNLGFGAAMRKSPVIRGVDLAAFEPDEPDFTPRIAGALFFRLHNYSVARLGHAVREPHPKSGGLPDYIPVVRSYGCAVDEIPDGYGFALQTYTGNGNPLPSYKESPYALPLLEDGASTAEMLWETLNKENRVAVVVKEIGLESGATEGYHIINKHDQA